MRNNLFDISSDDSGFTFIELMVVIVILGILAIVMFLSQVSADPVVVTISLTDDNGPLNGLTNLTVDYYDDGVSSQALLSNTYQLEVEDGLLTVELDDFGPDIETAFGNSSLFFDFTFNGFDSPGQVDISYGLPFSYQLFSGLNVSVLSATIPSTGSGISVPEPSTVVLLTIGIAPLLAFLYGRRRK